MEELKEALKNKNGKSPGQGNLNSELHKYAGDSFNERLLVLLITFIWWEKCRKNGETVQSYKKGDKQKRGKLSRNYPA